MERRVFLTSTLGLIPAIYGIEKLTTTVTEAMQVKFYCPRWGANDGWDSFCKRVKEAGFDGIETPVSSFEVPEQTDLLTATRKYNLEIIGQYYQSFEKDFDQHADNFRKHLEALAKLQPVFINSQTGKDFFDREKNSRLFEIADEFSKSSGINVVHETHRGKALFAANISRDFLQRHASLKLTLDISHWCNVHESFLQDQFEDVNLALSRTVHIHSRVGHPEGPQVNDPRAPEWKQAVDFHLAWWDKVVERGRKNGVPLTITTEFGPAGYLPVLPYTQQPVADQWEINVYMLRMLKQRYNTK
jgi:sugar phosphate isomerase/epimerase